MRRSWVWLRCASVACAFLGAAQGVGMLSPSTGPAEDEVVAVMQNFRVDVQGVSRTFWNFYWGFGWLVSVCLLFMGVLLWQMATRAKADPASVRPMTISMFVASVAISVLAWVYLFPAPGIVSTLIVASLAAALLTD